MSEKPKRSQGEYELTPEEAQLLSEFVTDCLKYNVSFGIAFEAADDRGAGGFLIEVGRRPIADRSGWQTRFSTMDGAIRAGYRVLGQISGWGSNSDY